MQARPGQKKIQAAETRAQLLSAGIRVFAERGYHAARLEDIAAAAGTTRGAVYWHFADKEDLLIALLERIVQRWNKGAVDRTQPPSDAIKWLGLELAGFVESNERVPWLGRLILMVGLDAKNLNPRVGALTRKAREPNHYLMARIIRYGQQAGLFRRDIDADQTGIVLAAVRTGLIACWRIDPEVFDLRRTTEAFVRTLLPALLGRTGGRRKIAMPKMDPEEAEAGVAEMLKSYGYSAAVLAPRGVHAKRRGPAEVMRRPNRTVKFHRATTGMNRGVGD